MAVDSYKPIYVGRIGWFYRLIFYVAVCFLISVFTYAFWNDLDSADGVRAVWSKLSANPYLSVVCIVMISSILYVETRKISFWPDHFCESKYLLINNCYRYSEIQRLGEDGLDGYLMIVLNNKKIVLVPEFLMNSSREIETLGMDMRDFLESRIGY